MLANNDTTFNSHNAGDARTATGSSRQHDNNASTGGNSAARSYSVPVAASTATSTSTRPRPTPAATRSYVSRSSTSSLPTPRTPSTPPAASRSTRLSRQSKLSHSIIKSGTASKQQQQKPSPSKPHRLTDPAPATPRKDASRVSRKGDPIESRRTIGRGSKSTAAAGRTPVNARLNATSASGTETTSTKPVSRKSTFPKDIVAAYQVFNHAKRLDKLLRKFNQFAFIKTKATSPTATPSGPPPIYAFSTPSAAASSSSSKRDSASALVAGGRTGAASTRLNICDNSVNRKPKTTLIEHFVGWRRRQRQTRPGSGAGKSKKPRRTLKLPPKPTSKDASALNAFISKQSPALLEHLRCHSLIIDPKDGQHLVREAFTNTRDLPASEDAPSTSAPVPEVGRPPPPVGPPIIPLDKEFHSTTAKGFQSSKKDESKGSGDKQTASSSKGHKTGATSSLSNIRSSPPLINLSPQLLSPTSKPGGSHAHKPPKKFNDKMRAEAAVIQRLTDLQKQGMMYESRLPKLEEPPRIKCHWDYLLEEMAWMATDFAQERKWKTLAARKCGRMVEKYWRYRDELKKKTEREEAQEGQKIAAFIAKEVKNFWANVQRLVEFKEMAKIEELRKKTVDLHLSMMVDQTEKFADMVASSFNPTANEAQPPTTVEGTSNQEANVAMETEIGSDDEFKPDGHESDDDEETIAKAEGEAKDVKKEVDLLAKESTQDLSEIYPQWLLDKITGKTAGDVPMSPSGSSAAESEEEDSAAGSESGSEDSESKSADEDESDADEEPEALKDNEGQTWDLTSLIQTFSPEHKGRSNDQELDSVTQMAQSFQPTGCTLSSTKVKTKVPVLLKHTLREYQHVGLDWLVTMFEKKLNGILADEMGLGKTIQTIALLAHLACEKSNWGPHLIIVPTSVMLNWEMEFKKWCPGFKILTYYGSVKDRRLKRKGWTKPNSFHVCITSYKLVVQDHHVFRRKAWKYLILDEAQNIKNFKSQRWQLLLNFNARRRLLLTGTPLQNNLMELWSLLHFLMPNVFQSHREFREWFSNPVTGMVEGNSDYNENIIRRLHKVLRPFILRRLKSEVEKQLPQKHEHVVLCSLSKRQRYLYEEFMSRTRTRETLATGNLLSVINVLMQLRKVCNHPNLFESRPIISPLRTEGITVMIPSLVWNMLEENELRAVHIALMKPTLYDQMLGAWNGARIRKLVPPKTSLKLTARLVLEEMVEASGCVQGQGQPENGRTYIKNTYSFKDERVFNTPRSKTPFPIVLVSNVDPTQYFEDREFFGALCDEANRLNKNETAKPRNVTPPRRTKKRLAESYPDETRRPAKISKLSTGQIEFVRTSSGKAGLVLTGSSYANGLTPNITEAGEYSPTASEDDVMVVNAAPLSYSAPVGGRQIGSDSPHSSEDFLRTPPKPKFGPDGQEEYGRPEVFVKHLSLLAKMSENQRTAQVEYNPFFEFRRNVEVAANIIHSHIALSSSVTTAPEPSSQKQSFQKQPLPQKRKHSETDGSDEYEDSDEDTLATDSSGPTRSETYRASKREFRPEDANLENSVFRNLKRIDATKFDAEAGLTWLRANNIDPGIFQRNDLEYRRLMDRKHVILRMNAINRSRGKVFPFYGYDTVEACRVFGVPDLRKVFNAVNPLRRDFVKSGYFKFGYNEVETYRIIHNSSINRVKNHPSNKWRFTTALTSMIGTSDTIIENMILSVLPSVIYIPSVETPSIQRRVFHPSSSSVQRDLATNTQYQRLFKDTFASLHPIMSRMATQFPDPRLIQYDCGKLQKLDLLLRRLSSEDHRVLIFTQMTKMLDVLEAFLNYHGYIYLRLDGSTKIDQRQLLMEKFNTDRRIFCFILSTRSGGIGVNLTGADTVIFYDSDWNPTMDAQAQDRCHRIGQTRDVHIYRLVSEKTVEENILLKSNQKRLLGELAIEGGNFTTAFFKKNTIRDLFDTNVVLSEEPMFSRQEQEEELRSLPQEPSNGEKTKSLMMETALASAEDESDVQAARTVRAEAAAELAEFDESIPLENIGEGRDFEEPPSAAAAELELIISELTPVERLAFRQMEETLHEWTTETYESAARVVENQKRQWELDQLAMNQQRLAAPVMESSDDEEMITYASVDAQNKVWLAQGFDGEFIEYMPLWEPPTPPSDDTDVYIDTSLQTLYHKEIIPEAELPPVYVPPLKKKTTVSPKATTIPGYPPLIPSPTLMDISSDQKKLPLKPHKREEPIFAPKSLFERPNPQVNKLRRDFKLQKHNRPAHVSTAAPPPIPSKPLGPESISFPVVSPPLPKGASPAGLDNPPWNVQEDNALLEGVSTMCELPQSLIVLNPSQTVNWDLICEHVNQTSVTHRSPKQCKARYETVVGPREEGKMMFDGPALVKKKKSKAFVKIGPPSPQRARPQVKTAQLMLQDNCQKYTEVFMGRFEAMRNLTARKLSQTLSKPPGIQKVGKQSLIFTEHGINYDTPQTAQSIAMARLERIQLERRKAIAAQEAARIAAQEAARIAAQTPIGTITLPAGQTISVQGGGGQQPPNSLLLQTLPQKLTPAQMEILKQNLVMSAQLGQLRQNQLGGTAVPLRPPYQRPPDPAAAAAVSLQGVKRIQVVPNSVQSTMGGVSFAITSSSITTTAQQGTIIPYSSTVAAQNSPIIQSQLQSSNISPGTIYQRSADSLSVHNVKRIQVVPNSIQTVGGVTFALTAPVATPTNISQPNIITLNTTGASQLSLQSSTTGQSAGQMVGPLPPVSVFQRGAESVSLQGVKRIQVVSNTIQPGGITFAVSTTATSAIAPTSHHSVISISAPMVSLGGGGGGATTGQMNIVQKPAVSAPIISMAPVTSVVSTVQSLGSLLSSTASTSQRFHGIQGPAGTPLTAIVRTQGQKAGQPQAFISSQMSLPSLNTLRPVIVRPRTYSPQQQQQIQSLQMQQLTQQQQAQMVVSSGTSQHSIFTLSSPITSTGQGGQRVTLVQQSPIITVTTIGSGSHSQTLPIISVPSSQLTGLTTTTASNLHSRLQALPISTSGASPIATLVKGTVPAKGPAHTFISTPIQYTPMKPGTTTQAQIPTQLIVQTTSKQLPASLQQFQQVFKQVIFRQPVQMLQGQPVAVSLGGTLARPVVSQSLPIRTAVPISAIAQISTGPPQAQARRLPLTLPLNTISAAVSAAAAAAATATPSDATPTGVQVKRFQVAPPILTAAPLIPNISKEAPPPPIAIKSQVQPPPPPAPIPIQVEVSQCEPKTSTASTKPATTQNE